MKTNKIPTEDGGIYTTFVAGDVEFVNPLKYYSQTLLEIHMSMGRDILFLKNTNIPPLIREKFLLKEAIKDVNEQISSYLYTKLPENLLALLNSQSKKDQIKLLNGLTLNTDQLMGFILRAWTDFGYCFSTFTIQHHHNSLDPKDLPKVAYINGDKIEKVGFSDLSDRQIKHAVKYRKVVVAKFLDNGVNWHCFFLTFKSLRGEESWNDGQPHLHYISDKFGIKRERVVSELKSKHYKLPSLPHIGFLRHND